MDKNASFGALCATDALGRKLPTQAQVGALRQDGRVCGVAYAHRGQTPPPGGRPYRAARGLDGETYQVLWQKVH